MNSQKAAYWFALALFALALHSEYRHGAFPALHRLAHRAGYATCQFVSHSGHALAAARLFASKPAVASHDFQSQALLSSVDVPELAEAQAELREQAQERREEFRDQVRAQAAMIRAQVDLERAQIDQFRQHVNVRQLRNLAHRRMVTIDNGDCAGRSMRVAVASMVDYPDDDEDSF
jgi:hypothetical protein